MGKGHKSKKNTNKGKGKPVQKHDGAENSPTSVITCRTLEEDEVTQCSLPATDGYPEHDRCRLHHKQYRTLYGKYKEASKIVDEVKAGNEIPTEDEIARYKDVHGTSEKARWMRKYLEAIRVEKTGREIHTRRFFGKADDGHKIRVNLLAKRMVEAVEILDALQARAYQLKTQDNDDHKWVKEFQASALPAHNMVDADLLSAQNIVNAAQSHPKESGPSPRTRPAARKTGNEDPEDSDLIDLDIQAQKEKLLWAFEYLINPNFVYESLDHDTRRDPELVRQATLAHQSLVQYARRAIIHEPDLSLKAMDKVSFKDLLLSDDFSMEDAAKLVIMLGKRLELGLLWYKDAVLEAIIMSPSPGQSRNVANVGNPRDRYKVLGGWIFTRAHSMRLSNEGWWILLQSLDPPANIENRFVRLCNNFDDLVSFLSFAALGMMPCPSFCTETRCDPNSDSHASRNHLSLCGIVVTDIITGAPMAPYRTGPVPAPALRSSKPGCITWAEIEKRAYMFGAVRNERDAFTDAFLKELRARPDLFQVITRSETDPNNTVDMFGAKEGEDLLPAMRTRTFEAPMATYSNRPQGRGAWKVERSAMDVLYSTNGPIRGYLASLNQTKSAGWFFHFKKMPVKYFLILDTVNGRPHSILSRNVAWAALRAKGLASGEYNARAYARASDTLFQKCAEERLSWMPKGLGGWHATKMEDSL